MDEWAWSREHVWYSRCSRRNCTVINVMVPYEFDAAIPVPLNQPCGDYDTCADANATCKTGFCRCKVGFFERRAVCGKCTLKRASLNALHIWSKLSRSTVVYIIGLTRRNTCRIIATRKYYIKPFPTYGLKFLEPTMFLETQH